MVIVAAVLGALEEAEEDFKVLFKYYFLQLALYSSFLRFSMDCLDDVSSEGFNAVM